jgi:protease IV
MTDNNSDNFASAFAIEALREQRRARRWNNFFKGLFFLYLVGILLATLPNFKPGELFGGDKFTALVEVQGVIASDSDASADIIVTGLRAAFEDPKTAGVIIRINSPGGSPVQSGYINDEIYRLKAEYPEIPVYAVIQDIGASGAYYVAVAANEIYADKASIVGSIGVRMDGFGFVESMEKLGIERRLLTAGENKGFLDPFTPVKENDVAHVRGLLAEIHEQFINTVRKGRQERLSESPELFSGYVWSGERSLELGLVDALGSASFVAREIIGAKEIVDFTPRRTVLDQFARRIGASLSEKLFSSEFSLR